MEQRNTRIHKIKLSISNCYLVQGEKNILVDTGSPNEGKKIIEQLKNYGLALEDISLIIQTHGHSDHCGSTKELTDMHKIPTAIHSADEHMIEIGKDDYTKPTRLFGRVLKLFIGNEFPKFKADIIIDNYKDLKEFGINGKIHSTIGHTKGSISIEFDNKEAIVGDIMMGGFLGGIIFPHLPDFQFFADDLNDIKKSIKKVLSFDCDKYYVGHGGPLTRGRVEKRLM